MNRPFRTGLAFGAGLSVALVLVVITGVYLAELARKQLLRESIDELRNLQTFRIPEVVRIEPELRSGQIYILATVRNDHSTPIYFGAEAVIFGASGDYYDTCFVPRNFRLKPKEEVSFRANCPSYGSDESQTMATLGQVKLQFLDPMDPKAPFGRDT